MVTSLLLGVGSLYTQKAYGALIQLRSLQLSNNLPDGTSKYVFSMKLPTAGMLGSIKAEFCDNTALFVEVCHAPAGFDLSAATITAQAGETGFSIDPSSNANTLILTRTPAVTPGGVTVSFTLDTVKNATAEGSQYARYSTFASTDASGAASDQGSVAYSLNSAVAVNTEVPPYLFFCVAVTISSADCSQAEGDYVDLGQFSTARPSTGQTQLVASTNASGGYVIAISGSTMVSGNNEIPPLTNLTNSAPGTSQFGVNLRANSDPNFGQEPSGGGTGTYKPDYGQPNRFRYRSGDPIASVAHSDDFRKYTVTYLVNISRDQSPGIYGSAFTYVATGNF